MKRNNVSKFWGDICFFWNNISGSNKMQVAWQSNFDTPIFEFLLSVIYLNVAKHFSKWSCRQRPVAALVFDSFVYMFKFVCFSKVWHNTIFYFNKIKYIFRFYFVDICNSLHSTPTRLPEIWIKQIKHCGTLVQFGADFARLFLFIVASNWGRNPST